MRKRRRSLDLSLLPLDMLMEVLLWCSAAVLFKLRAVCKGWLQLIESSQFAESHVERWRYRGGIATVQVDRKTFHLSYVPPGLCGRTHPHRFCLRSCLKQIGSWDHKLLDSCDGVLLFEVDFIDYSAQIPWSRPQLLVCNPINRSYKLLPYHGMRSPIWDWSIAYDDSTHRYKVIGITWPVRAATRSSKNPIFPTTCLIYELRQEEEQPESWKVLSKMLPFNFRGGMLLTHVSLPGKLHWLVNEIEDEDEDEYFSTKLLSMDLSDEVFKSVTAPDLVSSPLTKHITFPSRGKLYHARTCPNQISKLEVWIMDNFDDPEWFKCYVLINKPSCLTIYWGGLGVAGILQEGTKLIMKLTWGRGILMYDTASKQWTGRDVVLYTEDRLSCENHRAVYHVNSLIGWNNGTS